VDIVKRLDEIIIEYAIEDPEGRAMWKKHFSRKEQVCIASPLSMQLTTYPLTLSTNFLFVLSVITDFLEKRVLACLL